MGLTPDRAAVLAGVAAGLAEFGALVRSLDAADLAVPSRCAGWSVADVVSHVVGTVVDVTQGDVEGQGTPEVTARQAAERRDRPAVVLAEELEAALPRLAELLASLPEDAWAGPSFSDPAYPLGFAVEAIWYDAYLHGDDVRAALGRPSVGGDGLRCAVRHVAGYLEQRGCPPTTLELEGLEPVQIRGGGAVVRADPLDFVLAATGRADPSALGLDPAINVYAS